MQESEVEAVDIVVSAIIIIAINFCTTLFALVIAIKFYGKMLTLIIDECEKADRDELFLKIWKKSNR